MAGEIRDQGLDRGHADGAVDVFNRRDIVCTDTGCMEQYSLTTYHAD